ncbi:MAG: ammonium transporter [Odoribacteraceae bacterium]|nr:ammonium transporter [Odoribacteraceae bacterium]
MLVGVMLPLTALAGESGADSGNTAWMIAATVLVMLMTAPGLAFFYGGLVRRKNALSIMMQCLVITAVISIEWIAVGYSWVFGSGFMDGGLLGEFIGGFEKVFLRGVSLETLSGGGIPETLFALFQCMFAVITPALIIGAFAERINFPGFLVFAIAWALLVYNPMAHWVWGNGWMQRLGVIDFAGGTVVHVNAGVSALVMAVLLGRRESLRGGQPVAPHSIPFVVLGATLLWIGWFGFNAGSGLAADGLAANAFLVTHLATSAAVVTWMALDWLVSKKPTVVGVCTGAVAGLVAITPGAGSVDALGALFIGVASAGVCYLFVTILKPRLGYDDALDAFGVHGVGGFVGALLAGVFATRLVTGDGGPEGALYGDWNQLWIQAAVNAVAACFCALATYVLFKVVDKVIGLRITRDKEAIGLDVSQHGEIAYGENE